jgi:hypothetical protein
MQDSTMQLLTAQRDMIAFGARNTEQFSPVIDSGIKLGFTPLETQGMTNKYLSAGGHMYADASGVRRPYADFLRYKQDFNIDPGTTGALGAFESAFDPGGGAISNYTYPTGVGSGTWTTNNADGGLAVEVQNASINAARAAGVQPARMDEWVGRNASYLRAGAERNVNIAPYSFVDTMNYLPTSVQGFARAAGTENMRNTGMSMADELGNLMMPQELARGLMMANIVGKGGGPADWQKQMTDPDAFAGNMSDIYAQLPDMLKPFFLQSTTGLIGVDNFGEGIGGTKKTGYPDDSAGTQDSDIRKATSQYARNEKQYLLSIDKVTEYLEKFSVTIQRAIENMEKYEKEAFRFPM